MAKETISTDDVKASVEAQIEELKSQIARLNEQVSAKAEEYAQDAADWLDNADSRSAKAARALRERAHDVSETVRENPGTVSSALVLGGVLGLVLGMLLGQSSSRSRW